MPVQALVQGNGLNHKITQKPVVMSVQALAELLRLSADLNQLAKCLNSHSKALIEQLKTKEALCAFRHLLIGMKIEKVQNGTKSRTELVFRVYSQRP